MSPQQVVQSMTEHRGTTIIGLLATLGSGLLTLVPTEIREPCVTAVQNSSNPSVVFGLMAVGVGLTIAGPSLAKRA